MSTYDMQATQSSAEKAGGVMRPHLLLVCAAALAATPSAAIPTAAGTPPLLVLRGVRGGSDEMTNYASTVDEMKTKVNAMKAKADAADAQAASLSANEVRARKPTDTVVNEEDPERLYSLRFRKSDALQKAAPEVQQTVIELRTCAALESLGISDKISAPSDFRSGWEKLRNSLGFIEYTPGDGHPQLSESQLRNGMSNVMNPVTASSRGIILRRHNPYKPKVRSYPGKQHVETLLRFAKGVPSPFLPETAFPMLLVCAALHLRPQFPMNYCTAYRSSPLQPSAQLRMSDTSGRQGLSVPHRHLCGPLLVCPTSVS